MSARNANLTKTKFICVKNVRKMAPMKITRFKGSKYQVLKNQMNFGHNFHKISLNLTRAQAKMCFKFLIIFISNKKYWAKVKKSQNIATTSIRKFSVVKLTLRKFSNLINIEKMLKSLIFTKANFMIFWTMR